MRARTRPLMLLLIPALLLVGLLAISSPAQAYCDTLTSSITGRCDNPCTAAARAFTHVTGRPAPWDCLM